MRGKKNALREVATVRSEWRERLPMPMQHFLTWLIAYPFPGQEPLLPKKPWWIAVFVPASMLSIGVMFSFLIVRIGGFAWLGIPVTWLMSLNGARTLQVYICHHAVHGTLTGNRTLNKMIHEVISTVIFVQSHDAYENDHIIIHHPRLAGDDDKDRKFVLDDMKIMPGVSIYANKSQFLKDLFLTRMHKLMLFDRFHSSFSRLPPYRRVMTVSWLICIIVFLFTTQAWWGFIIGFVFPLTVLFHMSTMCQLVTEHFWSRNHHEGETVGEYRLALLVNRHLGDPLPSRELNTLNWFLGWTIWWTRLFFYHVPVRLGILVADLPVHGSHHKWPLEQRWSDSIYVSYKLVNSKVKKPTELCGSFGDFLHYSLAAFSNSRGLEDLDSTYTEDLKITKGN